MSIWISSGRRNGERVLGAPRAAVGFAEGGADRQDDVGVARRVVGGARAPDARRPEGERIGLGEHALAHQRGRDRRLQQPRESPPAPRRHRTSDTPLPAKMTGRDAVASSCGRGDDPFRRPGSAGERRAAIQRGDLGIDRLREHVHRNVDQHRAAASGLRQVQGARHHVGQELGVVDAPDALADRPEDVALRRVGVQANLLVRFARVVIGRRVAGDDDHRRPVGGRGGDARQRIRQARRQVDVDTASLCETRKYASAA